MIKSRDGITAMEILMVLVVAAILAALGTPWILGAIESYRVRTAAWEVAGDLRLARQRAVSTQVRHRFCILNCDSTVPTGGYLLEREGTPLWTVDLVRADLPNGVALLPTTLTNGKLTFEAKGGVSGAWGCIDVTNAAGGYKVVTASSGRVRVDTGACP
jgi:Tfp pilus assembly protein FimT